MKEIKGKILFVGHCYYNHWYLSKELRKLGWTADTLNTDTDKNNQKFYHGQDFQFLRRNHILDVLSELWFYIKALFKYDIFQFSGINQLKFGDSLPKVFSIFGRGSEIRLLKLFGKTIVYANNGCRDGALQTTFSQWKPFNVCSICPMLHANECSDHLNTEWGVFRNALSDYQLTLGGNKVDFNDLANVYEAPWAYSLDHKVWNPELIIPTNYKLAVPESTVKLYHSVGNFESRAVYGKNITIKSTHIYIDLVEKYKTENIDTELIFFKDVPNTQLRYYMAQADIVVDMLTYGFFGANIREALMMGKPSVCYLRPEWLASIREERPEFVDELPVVSATPDTIEEVLKELILNKELRLTIGKKSRDFAVKYFSSEMAAFEADHFYSKILKN